MERLMIDRVEGWNELGDKEKEVMVMDRVCRDEAEARAVEIPSPTPCPTTHTPII